MKRCRPHPSLGSTADSPIGRLPGRPKHPALNRGGHEERYGGLWHSRLFGDFTCLHCQREVLSDSAISGVLHRNHCPYCLWSRHVDLFESGDRLAVCKGPMPPVALAFKRPRKKYAPLQPGELQLVHRCAECGALSLNRLAADDLPPAVWDVFQNTSTLALPDVELAGPAQHALVHMRLFGRTTF
jgi:hypothetical protein